MTTTPTPIPRTELDGRLERFRARMDATEPDWELAAILGRVNPYYLTGTMQDGVLLVPRGGDAMFWVRRSFERARAESQFSDIRPMRSFRAPGDTMAGTTPRQVIGCGHRRRATGIRGELALPDEL